MDNIAIAPLNSFASTATQNDFPVSPVVTIPTALLQELQDGLQALQEEVAALHEQRAQDEAELAALRLKLAALETTEERDISRIALDIAYDRQRLAKLEKVEPQPMQKDRGEILRALLAANGGKMLAKDARQKMHLGKEQFSLLLSKMDEYIETKPFHQDKRKLLLIIK